MPRGFPGGSVDNNPPAKPGDMGSIPGPGRSLMPWNNLAHASQLLSLCSRAQGPQLLKPMHPRACAPQQEKPLQWEAHDAQLQSSLYSPQLKKKAHAATKIQHSQK